MNKVEEDRTPTPELTPGQQFFRSQIAGLIERGQMGELSTTFPTLPSRRLFLRSFGLALLGGSAALLVGCDIGTKTKATSKPIQQPVPPIQRPELVIPQEDIALKEAVEQQFNIELYNPAKAVLPYVEPHTSGIPIQWDEARLNTLRDSLPKLPEYFYQPSEQGRKLKLELTNGRSSETFRDVIGLSFVQFDPSHPREAFSSLTREFVYRVMPTTTLSNGDISSPWFNKLEQALGEDWMMISYKVGHNLNNRLYGGRASGEEKDFYQGAYQSMGIDSHAGFSLSPVGFIPNLASDYVRGKDYFTRMYGQIFPTDKVGQLHSFVKKDIFKGKEY